MKTAFPPGHFYSPEVDVDQCAAEADRIWNIHEVLGIDFNDENHRRILAEAFPRYIAGYDYPDTLEEHERLKQYFTLNSQFSWLDSRTLFVLLQFVRPKRIIEVGSGFSSLLTADVNNRFLANTASFTCIEPYPREFLRSPIPGLSELVESRVEFLPVSTFEQLQENDILFIDSSHVSKTGSDVNYLVFEILPRLKPGVLIHIHDIFLPNEYPKYWVLDEYRSWNEQYLIRALLMYSTAFKVYFGCSYAFHAMQPLVEQALRLEPGKGFAGGSLWIQKV